MLLHFCVFVNLVKNNVSILLPASPLPSEHLWDKNKQTKMNWEARIASRALVTFSKQQMSIDLCKADFFILKSGETNSESQLYALPTCKPTLRT